MARREEVPVSRLCVNEASLRKRRDYMKVVSNPQAGMVLHVSDDRRTESLSGFYEGSIEARKARIEAVSMEMWPAYINATRSHVP